jgi:hypothetical protein
VLRTRCGLFALLRAGGSARAILEAASKRVVAIECGAGLVIPSARCEAEDVAERFGTALIRINPTDYMAPTSEPRGIGLPLGSADALRRLWSRVMTSPPAHSA